jgi:BCCT family betaine/carnitine transporter
MLFCGGIGASILYWAPIEWAYYYQNPPFNLMGGSEAAVLWSTVYGPFHWGPIAWSIYLVPAIPISYFFYVRRQPVLKVSTALAPAIGDRRAKGWPGKVVDVLFVFGLLGGGATTLGLAAPLINEGLSVLLGIEASTGMQIIVLLVCTAIFGYSAYAGLDRASNGFPTSTSGAFWRCWPSFSSSGRRCSCSTPASMPSAACCRTSSTWPPGRSRSPASPAS